MKKLSVYVALTIVLAVCVAFASNTRSWPFSAPVVENTSSVVDPKQGNIIFDWTSTTEGLFKGFNGATWVTLGGGGSSAVPAGTILPYGGVNLPEGFLWADGTSYERDEYAELFYAISTAYGSVNEYEFNVPDLRGRFMRGVTGATSNDPDAAGRSYSNVGGNTGNNVGSLQPDDLKAHNHDLSTAWGGAGSAMARGAVGNQGSNPILYSTTNAGGVETRPKNVYVNYIIKY